MNDDTKLNEILLRRDVPEASTNLASRIASATKSKKRGSLIAQIMKEISEMLVIPRPAYALAFCLILGLFLGLQLQIETGETDLITQDWLSFTEVEEGDWL